MGEFKVGDVVVADSDSMCGFDPLYQKGDRAILKDRAGATCWWADFSRMGNRTVSGDGVWLVGGDRPFHRWVAPSKYKPGDAFDVRSFLRERGSVTGVFYGRPKVISISEGQLDELPPLVIAPSEPITRDIWLKAVLRWQMDVGPDLTLLKYAFDFGLERGLCNTVPSHRPEALSRWNVPSDNPNYRDYAIPPEYRT